MYITHGLLTMIYDISQHYTQAALIRPCLNLGCLFDIPTGRYYKGKNDEAILMGGLHPFTGIAGRGNMGKTQLLMFMILTAISRYHHFANGGLYDTEDSQSRERFAELDLQIPNGVIEDFLDTGRFIYSSSTKLYADEWWDEMRKFAAMKRGEKMFMGTLPTVDKHGNYIQSLYPSVWGWDSVSMATTSGIEQIYDKNKVGEAGTNTDALRGNRDKNQIIMQLPTLCGSANIHMISTAHIGDKHQLDPYSPIQKKLAFLKRSDSFKNVPEKYTFTTNNLWYCYSSEPMLNQATKAPEFPRDSDDDLKGDTDLMKLTVQNLRAKNGPTGMLFDVIYSQREGVHVGLTEFNYMRSIDRYGLGGSDRNYHLELLPDVNLQRTTIRGKFEDVSELRRASEIQSELCQLTAIRHPQVKDLMCTPKELYDGLKAKGYHPEDLYAQTHGWWSFVEQENPTNFLSTLDLLRINKGLYKPYWMA